MKQDYTLFTRTLPTGKKVVYYQYYDENGKRQKRSTGQRTKPAARNWLNKKIERGELKPTASILFGAWAATWWVWDKCAYIKSRRGAVGRTHADIQRIYLTTHILPFFEKMRLAEIGPSDVERWVSKLLKDGKTASMVNHCLRTLNVMMNEAERLELIHRNPARTVRRLQEERRQKGILTLEEAGDLFADENYAKYWNGNIVHYTINLTAASTGLRMGELQAIRVENVHDAYLHITHAWTRKYGLVESSRTKNHARFVPLPERTYSRIRELCDHCGEGFIFRFLEDTPVAYGTIQQFYKEALKRAKIDHAGRHITFHSWRHFFNTAMRAEKVPDAILRAVTGHRTEQMTEQYTSFQLEHYADVINAQKKLF